MQKVQKYKFNAVVCYSDKDYEKDIKPLLKILEVSNLNIWSRATCLKVGDNSDEEIAIGLRKSQHAILLLSKSYVNDFRYKNERESVIKIFNTYNRRKILIIKDKEGGEYKRQESTLVNIESINLNVGMEEVAKKIVDLLDQKDFEAPPFLIIKLWVWIKTGWRNTHVTIRGTIISAIIGAVLYQLIPAVVQKNENQHERTSDLDVPIEAFVDSILCAINENGIKNDSDREVIEMLIDLKKDISELKKVVEEGPEKGIEEFKEIDSKLNSLHEKNPELIPSPPQYSKENTSVRKKVLKEKRGVLQELRSQEKQFETLSHELELNDRELVEVEGARYRNAQLIKWLLQYDTLYQYSLITESQFANRVKDIETEKDSINIVLGRIKRYHVHK